MNTSPQPRAVSTKGHTPSTKEEAVALPWNREIEVSVLGAMIVQGSLTDTVIPILVQAEQLIEKYGESRPLIIDDRARAVYTAIKQMASEQKGVDLLTLFHHMIGTGAIETIGGPAYLVEITTDCFSSSAEQHARILVELYFKRETYYQLRRVEQDILTGEDVFALTKELDEFFLDIDSMRTGVKREQKMPEVVRGALGHLEEIQGAPQGLTGVPGGLTELDDATCGWQKTDLIVLAARPSQGKTALSLHFALSAAKAGYGVYYASLEMSSVQLALRMLAAEARVDHGRMRNGTVDGDSAERLARAAQCIAKLPIAIDERPRLTPMDVRGRLRRLRFNAEEAPHGLGLVVIDYIQLMSMDRERGRNAERSREQEVSSVSRALKAIAMEMKLPVVALSQMNRSIESRSGATRKPQLSDLRESGAIEQDCDVVMFIYRPEEQGIHVSESGESTEGLAEILIRKQRNGPTGEARSTFIPHELRFEDRTVHNMLWAERMRDSELVRTGEMARVEEVDFVVPDETSMPAMYDRINPDTGEILEFSF